MELLYQVTDVRSSPLNSINLNQYQINIYLNPHIILYSIIDTSQQNTFFPLGSDASFPETLTKMSRNVKES